MPSTKNLAAYAQVARIFEAALTLGGVRFKLETTKAAMKWRQEANYYRALLRKRDEGHCKYDGLVIKLDPVLPSTVVIEQRLDTVGVLTDLDGNMIDPPEAPETELTLNIPLPRAISDKIDLALKLEVDDDD